MSISETDKLFLTKNLATMLKAGVPLDEALVTVKEQSNPEIGKLIGQVEKDVENGMTLGKSFGKHPKVFSNLYVSLVEAGEVSGTLELNMMFLAEQMTKEYALKKKVQGALMYPGIVLIATTIMGTGISWFVLPQLIDLFNSLEVKLPLSTKILMWFAYFMRDYGLYVVLGMVSLVIITILLLRIRSIKKQWDQALLKVPFVGQVVMYGQLGSFSRNLGILMKSGLPVVDAFNTTINTLSNLKFVDDLNQVKEKVKSGKSIFESMNDKKYFEFQKLATRMIEVGEKSGNLSEMLLYVSDYYDGEIDNLSKNLSTLLEPILLLIGALVGFVAFAIITPIYSLVGGIGG